MTTQARRGSVLETSTAQRLDVITARNDDGSGEDSLSYKFDAANKQLVLVTNDVLTDPDYVLAQNVTGLTFDYKVEKDSQPGRLHHPVSISIAVKVGDNTVTLTGSAAPRRHLIY
jgi:hypothetical protein